jgi:hypothetical protein
MKRILKTIATFALASAMLSAIPACKRSRSTTIVHRTDNESETIKYSGRIMFNAAQTGIEKISNGGYLEFEKNGNKFKAENDTHGSITYLFNGDTKVNLLSDDQKQLVASAVKAVMKERANRIAHK